MSMGLSMAKLALIKSGHALVPRTQAAWAEFERLPAGPLMAEVKVPRNIKFHRLYWAMCTFIAEALNAGPASREWDQEAVSDRLKIVTGHVEVFDLPPSLARLHGTGKAVRPASISFAKMDDAAFHRFVEASIAYVLTEFGAWVQEHPNWQHVREILEHATGREIA